MRLLLILNENPAGSHDDVHRAVELLKEKGILERYFIYPFLAKLADGLSKKDVLKDIINTAKELNPTAILWSHTGGLKLQDKDIVTLRTLPSRPSMGYWDGDVYETPYKPLPREIIHLARGCDVAFFPGNGEMVELLKENGVKDIRYVPLSTDEEKFGSLRKNNDTIIFDVVMVGNFVKSKIPWRKWPGTKWRKEIAELFYKKLGKRFAVFGNGWGGPYAKGAVPFREQNVVNHLGRLALGVNNLHAQYFFSDRLPIAMSGGIPIIHNYEYGFEDIFKRCVNNVFFFNSTDEAWEITEKLLAMGQDELNVMGLKGREFALRYLTMCKSVEYMVNELKAYKLAQEAKTRVTAGENPWISIPQF